MNNVGLIYHPDYLKHDTGSNHPERPERLETMLQHLLQTPLWGHLRHFQPPPAAVDWIQKVHPEHYIRMIEKRCLAGDEMLDDGDTRVCHDSYSVALLAAGGVLQAVDQVMNGTLHSAFCAGRPPGHHAETAKVMGFCLFNNVAIGARYAQMKYGIERVAIVDWDVHHGNGTQEIFYEDPSVFFISLHQYPLWPGTGTINETGRGKGEGCTLNCPMKPGSGEQEYLDAFRKRILPALHTFQPQLLMISAGFDAHKDDPLANIQLTEESFAIMTEMLMEISTKYGGGKIVSVLEGGYDLRALARSIEAHLNKFIHGTM